jgi:ribonuclease Z
MVELTILGSAHAVPNRDRENTYFLVHGENRYILVDAPGNPISRMQQAGLDPLLVTDLVVTHFHPDHVSGVPLLLMGSWLMGRVKPLHIYGLDATLQRLEALMAFYDWATWPGMYPCILHHIPADPRQVLIDDGHLRLLASPVSHLIPTIGLRFDFLDGGRSLAYSCDTEPSPAVVELAQDADLLIHEATGASIGHSSAQQAGEIARQAGARKLMLIHYGSEGTDRLLTEAGDAFQGPVLLAEDLCRYPLG